MKSPRAVFALMLSACRREVKCLLDRGRDQAHIPHAKSVSSISTAVLPVYRRFPRRM